MNEMELVWGWQPAVYLFLGGMGAGAFITAGFLYLKSYKENFRVIRASFWAAMACLVVGLLLLLSDLVLPLRGFMLWQSFSNATSWMTFGAWIVMAATCVFFASAILMAPRVANRVYRKGKTAIHNGEDDSPEPPSSTRKNEPLAKHRGTTVLVVIGMVLGLGVAVYTGMLLMAAPGTPLWNTPLLPCLFTISALDTGVALVEIVAYATNRDHLIEGRAGKAAEWAVVILVAAELVVLGLFVFGALATPNVGLDGTTAVAAQSAALLVSGPLSVAFWVLVVGVGLIVPIGISILMLTSKKQKTKPVPVLIGAIGAVTGGCALRMLVLFAGLHANDLAAVVLRLTS